ncbi:LysM peptidoglycan-binding domain-containing protein [Haloferula rosea]|uniref:LysM peptidoglycan-binding domain-containing protein n=1 Tax=Haloferula rosea TaxID=490093 RepID=A0A934VDU7_9BACT|nr:LysM peptidoglycan-binding domain-containing protein [Haloferula rosea]MBK1825391.1 LysM peptidoglycan-binding domain-containing protein [Haloferula rosea]
MSVKRRPVKKRGFQTLFANVARKKKRHRAATSATPADFEGDVPNLGIARALVVILLIHVVAIGGIFFHSHWLSDDEATAKTPTPAVAKPLQPASPAAALNRDQGEDLPTIRSGDSLYTVGTGDTYQSIAQRFGIDEMELRQANENLGIRQGRVLRIPPKMITAVEPPVVTELRDRTPEVTPINPPAAPVAAVAPEEPVRVAPAAPQPELVPTEAARQADARASGTVNQPEVTASGTTYKVKSGDTFWAIAQRHGTTADKLMKINGISNARHLRVGATLVIPD